MSKVFLLLVLSVFALVSCEALSAPVGNKLALSKTEELNAQPIDAKRMLRAQEEPTNAADEERGMTELASKFKAWAAAFKTWVTNSKLVQSMNNKLASLTQKGRVGQIEKLLKQDNVNVNVLYQNKVKPDELFLALKLDPKLKVIADTPSAWANNPGLSMFYQYAQHYAKMTTKA
ncbi:hypothetical protein P3T76_015208 [Phytophthora citrophthora]|uniref:RxLR effector protein n=1 Tax=Phytophthora citrophthora TaxID=4793 RepID=A0AAD9LAH1_9STRA|nr:hypothetical protein P3T76_015208 [Phytophthora citrophthora]